MGTQRQRLWSAFHSARFAVLCQLWTDTLDSICVDSKDVLLGEYANKKVFVGVILFEEQSYEQPNLLEDDPNALRYVAVYILWKLLWKYKKTTSKHPNREAFMMRL